MPLEHTRKLMWDVIIADQDRVQRGWGLTNDTIKQEGMTSDEIAQVLKKKTHHVIPVIASAQIATLLPLVNQKTQHFGFVINSQSLKKPGMHWKAIYFDRKKAEVCYFDSLVSEPTDAALRGIKQIVRKMADPLYFKLKINRIKLQANDTSTCGPFALKFIADMYAGKPFKVATRFTDQHLEGEKSIRRYISKWGYIWFNLIFNFWNFQLILTASSWNINFLLLPASALKNSQKSKILKTEKNLKIDTMD